MKIAPFILPAPVEAKTTVFLVIPREQSDRGNPSPPLRLEEPRDALHRKNTDCHTSLRTGSQ